MTSSLRPLAADEVVAVESALALAAREIRAAPPLSMVDVQSLYDRLHRAGSNGSEDAVIALGIAFGEQFLSDPQLEWARCSDRYGDETVIAVRGKNSFCSPISMVQKRLRSREVVSLAELRDVLSAIILEHAAGASDR